MAMYGVTSQNFNPLVNYAIPKNTSQHHKLLFLYYEYYENQASHYNNIVNSVMTPPPCVMKLNYLYFQTVIAIFLIFKKITFKPHGRDTIID